MSVSASAPTITIRNHQIPRSLFFSLTGHAIVILVLTVKTVFFPTEDIIIANAVRVDLVALPDKIKPPQEDVPPEKIKEKPKEPPPEVKEKPPEPPPPKVDNKKVIIEKAQKEQMQALENLKNQLKRDQMAIEEAKKALQKPEPKIYKGNVLAPGSDVTGVAKIEYDKYFDVIRTSIKNELILPKWLKDANLKTHVLIKVDGRGFVIFKSVVMSSGNEMYDNLILTAITKASPLPAPPERLASVIEVDGITLRFPDK